MNFIERRIFIIPVGMDSQRAKVSEVSPDQIYLITQHHEPSSGIIDDARDNVHEVLDHFSMINSRLVYGVREFFNIAEIMSLFRFICDQHQDDKIFINVGSGSKLTAMAGFMISGWYDNVQCFYPKMKMSMKPMPNQKIVGNSVERTEMIQSFPVQRLNHELVPVLNFLKNNISSKKDILNFLQNIDLIATQFETDKGKMKDRSPQSLYNILKRNYLAPLEDKQLIVENSDGDIELTQEGIRMQLIFGKDDFEPEKI